MTAAAYSELVRDHYERPRNVGSFPSDARGVGRACVTDPECGDILKLQLRMDAQALRVEEARFKVFGCGPAIACGSFVTEWAQGKSLADIAAAEPDSVQTALRLPAEKRHCAVLAIEGLKAAAADLGHHLGNRADPAGVSTNR